jgi:hypothetical protein
MRRSLLVLPFAFFAAVSTTFGAISGSVMNVDGDPIPGCALTVHQLEDSDQRTRRLLSASPERHAMARAVTDERGSFRVEVKEKPVVDLVVRVEGYEPTTIRTETNEEHVIALRRAAPRTGAITADGKPVASAVVVWTGSASELVFRTDGAGKYTAPDPGVWAHRFVVLHPQYAARDSVRERLFFQKDPPMNLALHRGVTIEGTVTSTDGKSPIAGAKLHLDGWPAGETADDGTFRIAHAPEAWRWIEVSARGSSGARSNSGAATYRIPLSGTSTVRGTVVDSESGRGVAHAEIRFSTERSINYSVIADAKGNFSFEAPASMSGSVSFLHPGYPTSPRVLDFRQVAPHVLRAFPMVRITGTVVDDRNKPVAGARIGDARGFGGANYHAGFRSGSDGRFAIRLPSPGEIQLEAFKRGFLPSRIKVAAVEAGQHVRNVQLALQKGIEVAVRVVDQDGRAIAGARIDVAELLEGSPERSYYICTDPEPCTTNTNGLVALSLRPGKHVLTVYREGFVRREIAGISINRGQAPLEFILDPGSEISGLVKYDDGKPAGNVSVSASGAGAKTSADGTFVIRGVKSGPVSVRVQHPNYYVHVPPREVTAPAAGIVFELTRPATIRGRVIDRTTGRPITRFRAAVGHVKRGDITTGIGSHGPSWIQFATDDGVFALENVPAGSVEVLVSAEDYLIGRKEDVRVESGTTVSDVEVALERGVRLIGRVVTDDGEPLAGVNVHVRPVSWRRFADERGASATTNTSGEFTLEPLEPGELTADLSKTGFVWTKHPISIKEDETRVEFRLPRGYEIIGRVIDDSGQAVAEASVSARARDGRHVGMSGRTDAGGEFKIQNVPEGLVDIVAAKHGLAGATVPGVDPKAAQILSVTLRSGGVITGRVIGLEGDELRMARIHARVGESGAGSAVDSEGRFRIIGVAEGLATVFATSGGRRSDTRPVEVRNAAETPIDLTFKRAFIVRGRVTSTGKPVISAQVTFFPIGPGQPPILASTAAMTGIYEAHLEEPGEYRVRVSRGAGAMEETHRFTADTTRDFDLPAGSIGGRVVDAATGESLSDVAITAQQTSPRTGPSPLGRTDSSGAFNVAASPGRYVLIARKPGYGHAVAEVVVTEGAAAVAELRLQSAESLVVRPVDAKSGAPVIVNIFVYDERERIVFADRQRDFSPAIRIPLAPGNYLVLAQPASDAYVLNRARVSSPSDVTIALDRAATLIVVIRTPGRYRISVLTPEAHLRAAKERGIPIEAGTRRIGRLSPGTHIVDLLSEEGATLATRTVMLTAGEETRLDLP